MAYVKIKPIKAETHLQKSIDYIQNPQKTDNHFYVFSYRCLPKYAVLNFRGERELAIKKGNNVAWHIIQSFSPEDNISADQAMEIGKKLVQKMYPNHQYIIATHLDKGQIHNHIICNSVDFVKHKKIVSNKDTLEEMRKISDEICCEYGLSVITPELKTQRQILKEIIDNSILKSNDFEEFLKIMQGEKYQVKQGKYLAFKSEQGKKFMRTDTLGSAYTELSIKKRILNKSQMKNTPKRIYDGKYKGMSDRKILKILIDRAIKKSNTFDEFFKNLEAEQVEIKRRGDNYSFRIPQAERFIRLSSLHDDEYTLMMIRARIEDYNGYIKHKKALEENQIKRVDKSNNSTSTILKNININSATLKFLKDNDINSYSELTDKISNIENLIQKERNNIDTIKIQIADKQEAIKAIKTYWKLKPICEQAVKLKKTNNSKYAMYTEEHKQEIADFKNAIAIMEKVKKDGKLPKMQDLYDEIEVLTEHKDYYISVNIKTQEKLKNWKNIKYNVDNALNPKIENAKKDEVEISDKNENIEKANSKAKKSLAYSL